MKKYSSKIAVIVIGLLILAVIPAVLPLRAAEHGFVLEINGSDVGREEFLLLLRENSVQYERELCQKYAVPDKQALVEQLNGGQQEYYRLLAEKNAAYIVRLRVEQELAVNYGLMERFSWPWLLEQVDKENKSRAQSIACGEPVYGLREFSVSQYYSYFMSNLRLKLMDALPISVTDQDVDAYYRGIPYFIHMEGERIRYTIYDVTQAEQLPDIQRQELYAQIIGVLKAGQCTVIEIGDLKFSQEKEIFDAVQLRSFVRQDLESEFLLSLNIGEVTGPFSLGAHTYIVRYDGFNKAEQLSDSEREQLRVVLKQQSYETLVTQLVDQAEIKTDWKQISIYMEEGYEG